MTKASNVEFVPKATATVDLVHTLERLAARAKLPLEVINLLSPVVEDALESQGISARHATGQQIAKACGLTRPARRRKRA